MIVLLKLILAHLVGDFLLQSKKWVDKKEQKKGQSIILYLHALIHGLLVLLLLWDITYWTLALTLALLHGAIDAIKLYAQRENSKTRWFLIDQALHLVSIISIWMIWIKPDIDFLELALLPTIWIFATALLFITVVSGVIMQMLMSSWSKALNENSNESLPNAGKYIGMLERLFVFIFIITGNWQGIGFLLAAKSVFRFGDLKESKSRKLTEYILIGTLLSFGIATVTALITMQLMGS
ncbi:MAG: DUF3307 domain-containing protein [Dysgonamonadaceae bacterium]|nr:DUF3307 domain-containing protein [Dysgonamonadaceae bacterium]MDD4730226.1 DUF3307 domain-containing protein [Dysgonamonadaceae bacterium]